MDRLRGLPVQVVHAGHDSSFGRERLVALTDAWLGRHEEPTSAAPSATHIHVMTAESRHSVARHGFAYPLPDDPAGSSAQQG
jgi:hypothetical protein